MQNKTIEHFTHPGHRLRERRAETEYICDGCKTLGMGTSYQCDICSFNLHEYCGTCPQILSTFMHPHLLSLVVREAQGSRQVNRVCDVCEDEVEGLFYTCNDCEFDVHPVCTQLTSEVRHALHPHHPLRLESPSNLRDGWCAVCGRSAGNSWRYRCSICCFNIHMDCVFVSPADPNTTNRSVGPSAAGPSAPAYDAYAGYPPRGAYGVPPPRHYPSGQGYGTGAYGVPHPDHYPSGQGIGPGYSPSGQGYGTGAYGVPPYPTGQGYGTSAIGTPPPAYYPSGQGNGSDSSGRPGFKRRMYALVERLAVGVVFGWVLGMDG